MTAWRQSLLGAQRLWERLVWGLGAVRTSLAMRGLWPARECVVVQADGRSAIVRETRVVPLDGKGIATGVLVAPAQCLAGDMLFAQLRLADLGPAVKEALWRLSPVPPDQIVYAWEAVPDTDTGWQVHWILCRRNVPQDLRTRHGLPAHAPVFLSGGDRLLPVQDAGMAGWLRSRRRRDGLAIAALCLFVAMVLVPAAMPLLLKRQAVRQATQHVQSLELQADPLRKNLDELREHARVGEELTKGLQTAPPLASLVDRLAAAVPDGTVLDRIDVNGLDVRISGLTGNANDLLDKLSRQPGLTDARATGASVRDNALGKERFTFEMRWRPEGGQP